MRQGWLTPLVPDWPGQRPCGAPLLPLLGAVLEARYFSRPCLTEGEGSPGQSWGGTPAHTVEGKKPQTHWGVGSVENTWGKTESGWTKGPLHGPVVCGHG